MKRKDEESGVDCVFGNNAEDVKEKRDGSGKRWMAVLKKDAS
jgi:hypothetical protein